MNNNISIIRKGPAAPREIGDLRIAVGWKRYDATDARVLAERYSYYTARNSDDTLVGFLSVMSDGISALILDVMVTPQYQRQGLATRLVRQAVRDGKNAGIGWVQLTFDQRLAPLYANCGFHVCSGGFIHFNDAGWE